jgi:hypothetical protein
MDNSPLEGILKRIEEGDVDQLQAITHVLDGIKETEREKRDALENISSQRSQLVEQICGISSRLRGQQNEARVQLNIIDDHYRRLTGSLKGAIRGTQRAETTLKEIEETRRTLKGKKTFMAFKVPHHFHLTCLEHHLKRNRSEAELAQPFEIAQLFSGHLRVYCAARKGSKLVHTLKDDMEGQRATQFRIMVQKTRVEALLAEKRRECEEVQKLKDVLEARFGKEMSRYKRSQRPSSRRPASGRLQQKKQADNYAAYKRKYFQFLNVAQEDKNVQVEGTEEALDVDLQEFSVEGDDRTKLEMAFKDTTRWVSGSEAQAHVKQNANRRRTSSLTNHTTTWQELQSVADAIDGVARQKQKAWEELELVLDQRERVTDKLREAKPILSITSPTTTQNLDSIESLEPASPPVQPTTPEKEKETDLARSPVKTKDKSGFRRWVERLF